MNLVDVYKLYNQNKEKPLFEIDFSILQGLQRQTFYNREGERTKKEYRFNTKRMVVVHYTNVVENNTLIGYQKEIVYYHNDKEFKTKTMSPKLYNMYEKDGILTSVEGILYRNKCKAIKEVLLN